MKTKFLLGLLGLLCLGACHHREEVAPNQNVEALYEQFYEKYKIIRSTSSLALDANLDGEASTDMLEEVPDLSNALIEVRINGSNKYISQPSFYFVHYWPKQELDLHGFGLNLPSMTSTLLPNFLPK